MKQREKPRRLRQGGKRRWTISMKAKNTARIRAARRRDITCLFLNFITPVVVIPTGFRGLVGPSDQTWFFSKPSEPHLSSSTNNLLLCTSLYCSDASCSWHPVLIHRHITTASTAAVFGGDFWSGINKIVNRGTTIPHDQLGFLGCKHD